jgi:N-acetylmuramoyl-L-alanine amidase
MNTLLTRLAQLCLYASAVITVASTTAIAGGNGSLFSSTSVLFSAAQDPMDLPRARPLLYTDVEPVKIENSENEVFLAATKIKYSEQDLQCMTEALYHEARGEGRKGQAAVAEVILNRVDSRSFPSTVCGVINQRGQFSYTIGGSKPIRNKAAYLRARDVAAAALSGASRNLTGGATYFHTPAVRPAWSHRFQRTTQIGSHIFYRTGQRLASN